MEKFGNLEIDYDIINAVRWVYEENVLIEKNVSGTDEKLVSTGRGEEPIEVHLFSNHMVFKLEGAELQEYIEWRNKK